MNEDEVRQIVQDELEKSQSIVAPIQFHKHNGIDSARVDANDMEYALGYMIMPNLTTVPTAKVLGAIAMVNGKLYAFQTSSWVIVGTQS